MDKPRLFVSIDVADMDIKAAIPEGFLQRWIWCLSLKTYLNIRRQRYGHKLRHWRRFIDNIDNELLAHDPLKMIVAGIYNETTV